MFINALSDIARILSDGVEEVKLMISVAARVNNLWS